MRRRSFRKRSFGKKRYAPRGAKKRFGFRKRRGKSQYVKVSRGGIRL